MKKSSHIDVYQMVTDLIVEKLEQGIIPWKQPWNDFGPASNYISKKPYHGINQLILNGLQVKPFYLTFKQAKDLGGRIRKGAKSIPVVYWNFVNWDKETNRRVDPSKIDSIPKDNLVKTAFLKYYRVFNIDDVLHVKFDLPEINMNHDNLPIERCEQMLVRMKDRPQISHTENQAYYHPIYDYINMPPIELFKSAELYHYVFHHELIHFTGHPTRLNRFANDGISSFNSSYTKEELIAEIGAAFLNNHCSILNDDTLTDSSAYIQGWLKKLKNDKKFIIEASVKAQKAVEYILN